MIQLPQGKARRAGFWFGLVFLFNLPGQPQPCVAWGIATLEHKKSGWPKKPIAWPSRPQVNNALLGFLGSVFAIHLCLLTVSLQHLIYSLILNCLNICFHTQVSL